MSGWGNQPHFVGQQLPGQGGYQGGNQGWGEQNPQGYKGYGNQGIGASSLFTPDLDYIITTALDNSKALDVSQGNNKYNLLLWSRHGNKNQRFRIKQVTGGRYQIFSALGGTVEIPNGSTANGIQVFISQTNNTQNEYWQITPANGIPGGYYIKSFCGKALDVSEEKTNDGTPVIQYQFNGHKNQIWYFNKA